MANRRQSEMPLGPSRRELVELLRYYSLRAIARRYEVSATTARRWAAAFGIQAPRGGRLFPIHDL